MNTNDKKDTSPTKLFLLAILLNMKKRFYVAILIILSLLMGTLHISFIKISIILFILWMITSILDQIIILKTALYKREDKDSNKE